MHRFTVQCVGFVCHAAIDDWYTLANFLLLPLQLQCRHMTTHPVMRSSSQAQCLPHAISRTLQGTLHWPGHGQQFSWLCDIFPLPISRATLQLL